MSGSGPLGPSFHGVWQSLQLPKFTRYLPRSMAAAFDPGAAGSAGSPARRKMPETSVRVRTRNGIARRCRVICVTSMCLTPTLASRRRDEP